MKIAIVHDHLTCRGGGEQVALAFHRAFPNAPIYTLAYDPEATYPEFRACNIKTSWFQKISNKEKIVKAFFFPLGVLAAHQIDVTNFDIILISTTHCAKYVKIHENALVICYAHNPFRLAWYPQEYEQYKQATGIKRWIFDIVISVLQNIDKKSLKKVDFLVTNSSIVKERLRSIYNIYRKDITIISPPVNLANFSISMHREDYFLVVSRLESYKRVELVIDSFNQTGLPLIIVGKGILQDKLKKKAAQNITFKSNLSKEKLEEIYNRARALIFPQLEDYGITPLEANASGVPVIAFGEGGVLDTQVYLKDNIRCSTAIFFQEQTVSSLGEAIATFEKVEGEFDSIFIRENAKKFSEDEFIKKTQEFVRQKSILNATLLPNKTK